MIGKICCCAPSLKSLARKCPENLLKAVLKSKSIYYTFDKREHINDMPQILGISSETGACEKFKIIYWSYENHFWPLEREITREIAYD